MQLYTNAKIFIVNVESNVQHLDSKPEIIFKTFYIDK